MIITYICLTEVSVLRKTQIRKNLLDETHSTIDCVDVIRETINVHRSFAIFKCEYTHTCLIFYPRIKY